MRDGHGVRPIAVALRDLMRRFVNYLDQAKFVSSMNRQFVESSSNSVFATAVVTTFFAPTRTLSVCNAGHPPPLIYRSATKRWSFLESTGESRQAGNIPLGIMEMDAYEQFDVDLDVGDLVLVYTDALMEASDGTEQMLGLPGLLELVSAAADPSHRSANARRIACRRCHGHGDPTQWHRREDVDEGSPARALARDQRRWKIPPWEGAGGLPGAQRRQHRRGDVRITQRILASPEGAATRECSTRGRCETNWVRVIRIRRESRALV